MASQTNNQIPAPQGDFLLKGTLTSPRERPCIPNGTFEGTFEGWFSMEGDLSGSVTLELSMDGEIEEIDGSDGDIRRKSGTVRITGTATSRYGVFPIELDL